MKPATEGQFHQVIARLLTNTPYEEIQFEGMQSLIQDPDRLVEEFSRFLSYGGITPLPWNFPIWKILRIPNEPLPAHHFRLEALKINISDTARAIIEKWQPNIPEKKRSTYFVKVTPAMLGMSEYNSDEFFSRAYHNHKLSLCGAHETLFLRAKYREQTNQNNSIYMAMVPYALLDKVARIFSLSAIGTAPEMRYCLDTVDAETLNINSEFVFQILVK